MIDSLNIIPLDSAYSEPKYLMSYQDRHFVISESLAEFIKTIKKARTFEEAAHKWSILKGRSYTADDVRAIYETYIAAILNEPQKRRSFLWEKKLISGEKLELLQQKFKVLFRPVIIICIMVIVAISEIYFFTHDMIISIRDIDILTVLAIAALILFSSFFHEIGHASACSYFGEKAKGIGLGIYLNFPVFYTDVSGIWKLSRKKRMVVNFAGTYFQLIFLLPCFAVYFLTGSQVAKYLIYTINLNFIFTLNPFFKFDGYWIMSDLIGIPNLRDKSNWFFQRLKNKILRKHDTDAFWSQIKIKERILMTAYTIGVNAFFFYYIIFVLPKFLKSCWVGLPGQIKTLVTDIAVGNSISFSAVSSIAAQLIISLLIFFFCYKFIRRLIANA